MTARVSARDGFDGIPECDTARSFDCCPHAEGHLVVIGDSSQEMPVLRSVLLGEVDHDASSKPPAWSQDNLGTDANGSSEPFVFRKVASRYIDEQVGAEPQRIDRLPQEILESSQGGGADQAYRSLVMVHDLSLALDRDATGEHRTDSLMPRWHVGGEAASVGQLDKWHRLTEMPAFTAGRTFE